MLSVYNLLMGSTDMCNSFAGDTEGLVGGTGGAGDILVFVHGHIVERRPCQVLFMGPQRVLVDAR